MERKQRLTGRDYVREKVRERDKRTCQNKECGKKWEEGMRRFDVHHLNGLCGKKSQKYDRISEMDGLITLCHKCHLSLHVNKDKLRRKGKLLGKTKEIKKLLKQGKTYAAVGAHFGVSQAAISKHLITQNRKLNTRVA